MKESKVAVIGAGMFGLFSAVFLARRGFQVTVFEKNSSSFEEASSFNQARVHGGYHYPRSLKTAYRCRASYRKFISDFSNSIIKSSSSFYLISQGSKTSPEKFERICRLIGAPLKKIPSDFEHLFRSKRISGKWQVDEVSFDSTGIASELKNRADIAGVSIKFGLKAKSIEETKGFYRIRFEDGSEEGGFAGVVNATYGDSLNENEIVNAPYQYEVCELLRVRTLSDKPELAITVMDGPFWSFTPWPKFNSSVLTHVRFTPHNRFSTLVEARRFLEVKRSDSRGELMIRAAASLVPEMSKLSPVESHFIIKTIPSKRDLDDSRPIMFSFENHILRLTGSKIDMIYDVEPILEEFAVRLND
jgi:glycine/D-amino acid oxidase-like deaminating enzyme